MTDKTEIMARTLECLDIIESGDATPDQVAAYLDRVGALSEYVKTLKSRGTDAVMEWIRQHGDLVVGDVRYYVGTSKKTIVTNNAECFDRLLDVFGGDVQAVAEECLASNPYKVTAVKHHLGENSSVLQTLVSQDLKTGKPKKELKKVDTRFIKGKK